MSPQEAIGHYRITAKLGEGGMGAVYRATDTKLSRDVAVKVLPDSFAADADRLARFTREAQVLASLNHPNIASIYGVEERALILELVEGPTLAERIAAGPIPLEDAVAIARQIAEALEYAHDRGVVHRDLKPANVKVTADGRVKVLDFGLAKAMTAEAAGDPIASATLTMRATMAGMIMGTPGYMSPEQAKGKPVDRRADIWAFGVVLVEMLTGREMYAAETISETLAAVLMKEPEIPAGLPGHVTSLLRRCLEKDPKWRLQSIGEARIALERPAAVEAAPAAAVARGGARWWMVAAAAIVPALVLGGMLWRAMQPEERPLARFSVELGDDAVRLQRQSLAISPDGQRIAHAVRAQGGLAVATRLWSETKPTLLTGPEAVTAIFFSPDGQWIGYFGGGNLRKVSVRGGATVPLCDAPTSRGAWWAEDGYIYGVFDGVNLARVSAGGGKPEVFTANAPRIGRRWPQVLPGGEAILLTVATTAARAIFAEPDLGVYFLKTGQYKVVQPGGRYGRYLPSGYLIYARGATLFAVKFDLKKMETQGTPTPVLDDVLGDLTNSNAHLDFARNGTLAYLAGTENATVPRVNWLDALGKQQPILSLPKGQALTPRLSPNGKLLALAIDNDLIVYDPARESSTHLTFPPQVGFYPVWMPDGKHIVFSGGGEGIWWAPSDGSGKPEILYDKAVNAIAQSISPDGKTIAFHQTGEGRDLYTMPLDLTNPEHPKAGTPALFLATKGADVDPAFSPDGKWLAYATSGTGSYHVFVRPFPAGASGAGQAQISAESGRFPVWSPTSKVLYYVSGAGQILAVPYAVEGQAFVAGKPKLWSETRIGLTGVNVPLDITPDGKRFVVFPDDTATSEKGGLHAMVLLNFFDEVKRRVQ